MTQDCLHPSLFFLPSFTLRLTTTTCRRREKPNICTPISTIRWNRWRNGLFLTAPLALPLPSLTPKCHGTPFRPLGCSQIWRQSFLRKPEKTDPRASQINNRDVLVLSEYIYLYLMFVTAFLMAALRIVLLFRGKNVSYESGNSTDDDQRLWRQSGSCGDGNRWYQRPFFLQTTLCVKLPQQVASVRAAITLWLSEKL